MPDYPESDGKSRRRQLGKASYWCRKESDDMHGKKGGSYRMRVLRAAAIMTLLLAGPAYAQRGAPAAPTDPPKSQTQIEQEKATENAYKRSLRNIPDQPAADPWGGARAVEEPKPVAKDPPGKKTKASSRTN